MSHLRAMAMGLVLAVGLSVATTADAATIAGHWRCVADNSETSLVADVEYVPNGDTNISFEMTERQDGIRLDMSGFTVGTWEIDGNMLIEKTKDIMIHRLLLNDEEVPEDESSAYLAELKRLMTQSSTAMEIVTLEDDMLILDPADGQSPVVTCTPRG